MNKKLPHISLLNNRLDWIRSYRDLNQTNNSTRPSLQEACDAYQQAQANVFYDAAGIDI